MNSIQQTSLLTGATMVLPDNNYGNNGVPTTQTLIHKSIQNTQTASSTAPATQMPRVTQVIIKREAPASSSSGQSLHSVVSSAANQGNYTHNQTSPTRTITLSSGGIVSPQRVVNPTTPTKQIVPVGKIPISPMKTPTKFIISTTGGSPRKLVSGNTGSVVTLVSKHNIIGSQGQKTVTVSPTKVVIKGQQNTIQQAQKIMASSTSVGASVPSSLRGGIVPAGVQPLPVAGSKFQYVRLVTTSTAQPQLGAKVIPGPVPSRAIAPAGPVKISLPSQHQQMQISRSISHMGSNTFTTNVSSQQRLILPATSHRDPIPIQPQPSSLVPSNMSSTYGSGPVAPANSGLTQLPQGATCFALVPAQYVTQIQPPVNPQQVNTKQESFVPVANMSSHQPTAVPKAITNGPTHAGESGAARPKKACNCTKSQCLKLYCDCFANGEFCSNCNCTNCFNNLEHEDERSRAIKACLERNPLAFHPKIGKTKASGGNIRRHNKGCNCKRSGCLKNYCECYEAKILCSNLCKCVGCKNFEESPDRKTLMHLADAAEVRVQQQTAVKTKTEDLPTAVKHSTAANSTSERLAYTFVTEEVIEATCACMLAQAEEAERTRQNDLVQERLILQEFGRCLMQVIEAANRTKAPSPV